MVPSEAPIGLSPDQILIWEMMEKIKIKLLKKNLAYGSAVFSQSPLTRDVPIDAAIRVRMGDKINRLGSLLDNPEKNMIDDESIKDTMMDLATYGLLWIIQQERMNADRKSK